MPAPPLGITARAKVIRWIDADTVVVEIGWPVHVRLQGIDAPKVGTPAGDTALAFAERLCPPGDEVIVHVSTEGAKSVGHIWTFERVPGQVWLHPDNNRTLSELLADHGHAEVAS